MKTYIGVLILLFIGGWCFLGITQESGELHQLPEEEQKALEAIALYPDNERAAILTAAQYPEVLVRMENIRQKTEEDFQELLSGLSEDEQGKMYNIIRYPDLLAQLTERDNNWSRRELNEILEDYPEEVQEDAQYLNRKYLDVLQEIHYLYTESDRAFNDILTNYPPHVRQAYEQLLDLPEVVSVLTAHMNMTVLLGDIYRNRPVEIEEELDSLGRVIAERRAKELTEWKQQLEENPEAMYEYEEAAREFAEEEGYDDEVYDGPIPERYSTDVYVHHIWRPYPYWFGWPSWYTYESWYPYPWWHHWGYYYGPRRSIVIIGLPSRYFVHWHFRHDRHFYYYPHFTNEVIDHYYGPRKFGSSIHAVVRDWEKTHRAELPEGWFEDDGNRVARIREYGEFKMDYASVVRQTTDQAPPTQREFLKENARKYPTLKPVLKEKPEEKEPRTVRKQTEEPDPVYRPEEYKPRQKVIKENPAPKRQEIDRAKEHHENTWDQIKRVPRQEAPSQTTQPTTKQAPKTQPRTTQPKKQEPKAEPAKEVPRKRE